MSSVLMNYMNSIIIATMMFWLFRSRSTNVLKKKALRNTLPKYHMTLRERIKRLSTTERSNVAKNVRRSQRNSAKLATTTRILKPKTKEKISCDTCKITFDKKGWEYKRHMLKHDNHYNFECNDCGKKYEYKHTVKRHILMNHMGPLYTCQYCDFSTLHSSDIQVHFTRKHTDDFRFSCDKCDRKFWLKTDYTHHLRTHEIYPCICDVCGIAMANRMSLYCHKYRKHKVKDANFQCPVCKQKLKTQRSLDRHVKQHEQKYKCEHCSKEFMHKYLLNRHMRTHSGEKLYSCHLCEKSFTTMYSREMHLLTHSETRPYICTICGRGFRQRSTLRFHWKTIHPHIAEVLPSVSIKNVVATMTLNRAKIQDAYFT